MRPPALSPTSTLLSGLWQPGVPLAGDWRTFWRIWTAPEERPTETDIWETSDERAHFATGSPHSDALLPTATHSARRTSNQPLRASFLKKKERPRTVRELWRKLAAINSENKTGSNRNKEAWKKNRWYREGNKISKENKTPIIYRLKESKGDIITIKQEQDMILKLTESNKELLEIKDSQNQKFS